MHNCKANRKRLIEQAMDQRTAAQSDTQPAEFDGCPECLEELAAVAAILRVADQALDSARPAEGFWTGYHARLRQSLDRGTASPSRLRNPSAVIRLRNLFAASVRVPVPVAALLVLFFGMSIVFAVHSRRQPTGPISGAASVVTRTVEVPVVRERTVTRVLYRDRVRHRTTQVSATLNAANRMNRRKQAETTATSLIGFKPANEAKLTIIKGSYRDDK